jgi:hypothetical protein
MKPRMNALLDLPNHDNLLFVTNNSMGDTSSAKRPRQDDATSVSQHASLLANPAPGTSKAGDLRKDGHDRSFTTRAMPSAPIAQVLNNESNILSAAQPVPATSTSSTTAPFSGRLADLLLDDSTRQRWDQQIHYIQPEATGTSPSVIKLPRLPQPPKKTAKRPRIPPLLQGLHQPPPLPPDARLFPPITGEKNAFVGERSYETLFEDSRNREVDEHAFFDVGTTDLFRTTQHGEITPAPQLAAQPVLPNVARVAPENDVTTNNTTDTQEQANPKRAKKRNRWSEQETKDLLLGVSRYGIGNWKKILQNSDFAFNNRTAVDLKDRFRVCCPGEGSKQRKPKNSKRKHSDETTSSQPPETAHTAQNLNSNSQETLSSETATASKITGQQYIPTRSKTLPDLAELGIREPFSKNTRRPRRAFSERDDTNLLKGFDRHGTSWHSIRDDMSLDFSTRHPTDLRDRFRIRYPEKYAKAGYKLKSRMTEKQTQADEGNSTTLRAPTNPSQPEKDTHIHPSHTFPPISLPLPPPSTTNLKLPFSSSTSYLSDPLPFDSSSFLDEIPADEDESPITLNRNILRWADANPSSLFPYPLVAPGSGSGSGNGNGNGNGYGYKAPWFW